MCAECLVSRKKSVSASKGVGESGRGRPNVGDSLFPCCVEAEVRGCVGSWCGSAK